MPEKLAGFAHENLIAAITVNEIAECRPVTLGVAWVDTSTSLIRRIPTFTA
jgi:hypothetical protein